MYVHYIHYTYESKYPRNILFDYFMEKKITL